VEAQLIQELIDLLQEGVSISPLGFLTLAVVVGVSAYVGTYLRTKATNLATKEDIEEITDRIEGVRGDHAARLERLFQHHRLQLAALERRLEVHQQAYTLWRKLLFSVHTGSLNDVVVESERWWNENCLYLGENARNAFLDACHAAHLHPSFLREPRDEDAAERNWERIQAAGDALVTGAGLPPLGGREAERFDGEELEAG